MVQYSQVQAAIVHFRDEEIRVRVGPPGDRDNAIVAASNIIRKNGRFGPANEMLHHRDECFIDWGRVTLTKKGQKEMEELLRLEAETAKLEQKAVFPKAGLLNKK